jgi:hypothetical protein
MDDATVSRLADSNPSSGPNRATSGGEVGGHWAGIAGTPTSDGPTLARGPSTCSAPKSLPDSNPSKRQTVEDEIQAESMGLNLHPKGEYTQLDEIRDLCVRWMAEPDEPGVVRTLPASPDDVIWLLSLIEQLEADRDQWKRVALHYQSLLGDRGLL